MIKQKSNNYILDKLLTELNKSKSKIRISYKGGKAIEIKGKRVDAEEMTLFCIGLIKELYANTNKNIIFNKAVLEALNNLSKEFKNDIEEVTDEKDR